MKFDLSTSEYLLLSYCLTYAKVDLTNKEGESVKETTDNIATLNEKLYNQWNEQGKPMDY